MYCAKCGYNNSATEITCKNCEVNLQPIAIKPSSAPKPATLIYAEFKIRLFASFLDSLLILVGIISLGLVTAIAIAFTGRDQILSNETFTTTLLIVIAISSLCYFILLESSASGATIGKRWLNIKVIDINGQRLSIKRSAARLIAHTLSHLPLEIGFLIQPFTPRKQALHDMLTGTLVVYTEDSKKISIYASLLVILIALLVPTLAFFSTAGIPMYQQYIQEVQIGNGMSVGKSASLAVSRFYANNGRVPADIMDVGRKIKTSPHVAGIILNPENGELTVHFSETVRKAIKGKTLLFSPSLATDQSIIWKCSSKDIEARLLPEDCK